MRQKECVLLSLPFHIKTSALVNKDSILLPLFSLSYLPEGPISNYIDIAGRSGIQYIKFLLEEKNTIQAIAAAVNAHAQIWGNSVFSFLFHICIRVELPGYTVTPCSLFLVSCQNAGKSQN